MTNTERNDWATAEIDQITDLAKQLTTGKLKVEDIPDISLEATLSLLSTISQIAIEGIIRDISNTHSEDVAFAIGRIDRGRPTGTVSRGADDSFFDYIPGGLDVLDSVYRLGINYYTDDSFDWDSAAATKYVQDWLETMDPTNIYLSGDCSGNMEPYILRLHKQLGVSTEKFDSADIEDYTEEGQL